MLKLFSTPTWISSNYPTSHPSKHTQLHTGQKWKNKYTVIWIFKPAIHYSQTRRIGDKTIFSPNKILFTKAGRTCYYTPFVVRCQFLREHIRHWEFFLMKNSSVFVEETFTLAQILWTAYSEKPARKTWRTPTIHYSLYVIFLSFYPCFILLRE